MITLIWPSLIILHSPTSKLIHTVLLHISETRVQKEVCQTFVLCLGVAQWMLPRPKTLSAGALKARMALKCTITFNVHAAQQISGCHNLALLRIQKSTAMSPSHYPSHVSIWLKARPPKHQSQCLWGRPSEWRLRYELNIELFCLYEIICVS